KLSEKEGLQKVYSGSWDNITMNMNADGYRLPTEAEWEYAAKGGNLSRSYKYSGSNNAGDVAWYGDNSKSKTHPVGQKQQNELGIYDMSGNVWEWCWDWYGSYSSKSQTNPTGPKKGSERVGRGGSWFNYTGRLRPSDRDSTYPYSGCDSLGLRLARSK
ncbi:MAG: formylglycine-generating enzyme family protein, partial [Thermoanaerobaculia bacterium]|nr:formylglycine-generating enzyme family protein [Thermoanaerobaculia bacterium]